LKDGNPHADFAIRKFEKIGAFCAALATGVATQKTDDIV
jgi:hypothetical protein